VNDEKPPLRFFLDEGVPVSVGDSLKEAGHEVILLSDAIARGATDTLVCAAALANEAILVAQDGDMKEIAKRHGAGHDRFAQLSLLKLSCKPSQSANRIRQALSLIEHEWAYSEGKAARRLFMIIGDSVIRTHR
jgi:predicted nuclease of predicted toxin-antitoxin system